jgi:predicted transcriptional regulator
MVVDNHDASRHTSSGMKQAKAMTIRLSADQAEQLETVAAVDQQPVSEVIRAAIANHISQRTQDQRFQDGLKGRIERAKQLLVDED